METGIHELTAGYALDALEADERRAYEDHLPDCAQCQKDLVSFWEVTGALALAATGPEPPPELRERIIAAARAESQGSDAPIETSNVVAFRRRRFGSSQALSTLAAIAAVALIALGWWAVSLHDNLADTKSALAEQRTVTGVLADTGAQRVTLAAGSGTLVNGSRGAVLVVDDLEPAAAGKTYEVWVIRKGVPASSGLFAGGSHSVVLVQHAVATGDVVAVTLEKAGGAKTPTSTPVVASNPA